MTLSSNKVIYFKKVTEWAEVPSRKTEGAAGYDLHYCDPRDEDCSLTVPPKCSFLIPTGVAVCIPSGYVGLLRGRSSSAGKNLLVFEGTIDSDYRGQIYIRAYNLNDKDFVIKSKDRIAQLVIVPCHMSELVEAASLSETVRGEKGFGSTGTS